MIHFKLLILLFAVVSLEVSGNKFQEDDPGQPLYLTPLIKAGEIEQARQAALVQDLSPIRSYSGFITVDEEYDANTFFWYFPSELNENGTDESIPIVLWMEGGPGLSDMRTVFSQTGPFLPVDEMDFISNPASWHKKYHMIYIDNPIGAGFSHTFDERGNMHSATEAAQHVYKFLQQFFQMFPNLQPNPFYQFGVSYGGKFGVETAQIIHTNNQDESNILINLTGVIGDSPWLEAYSQANFANVLFGAGVISKGQKEEYLEWEAESRSLIEQERWAEASALIAYKYNQDIFAKTGYNALGDLIDDGIRGRRIDMSNFIKLNSTRKAMHVGNLNYYNDSQVVKALLGEDSVQSSVGKLDNILKNDYKYLLLVGNVDVLTGHLGYKNIFENSITWEGRNELVNGNRTIWRVDERVAGYKSKVGKVEMVRVRNAGHDTFAAQPVWHWDAVQSFIDG